jgi:putative ATP-dependent endonuclease of OLD family
MTTSSASVVASSVASTPAEPSCGVRVVDVRVSNFRSLENIEVDLGDLMVMIGANNAGKTSFLDALYAAIGAVRKPIGLDDIRLAPNEALPPKTREITIDVRIRPVDAGGAPIDLFPSGSYWTSLWGPGIIQDPTDDFKEFVAFRTTLAWNAGKGDYALRREFLKEWRSFADWLKLPAPTEKKTVSIDQIEPVALHYIDAKRDLEDDLRKQGSFWRRLTEDLGLSEAEVAAIEAELTGLNEQIVSKSGVLKHLKTSLADMQKVISADSAGIDITPVSSKLRDMSKGVDVSFATTGAQAFPLARHGMGTRSLASLLVFNAFASWRSSQAASASNQIHTLLALEEPESHLHPQAQRSLFSHIKSMPGQRVVSTHSPYFAGQAELSELRLFKKRGGDTFVTKLDLSRLHKDVIRKLQQTVIDSRGDLLFAGAVVFFEGHTEESALPVWAKRYWGRSIHELGLSFARVNGTDYYPYLVLANQLEIPWYVFSDGEAVPLTRLNGALNNLGLPDASKLDNVVVIPDGRNFEQQLVAEGYLPEIEAALDEVHGATGYLDGFIADLNGESRGRNKGVRNYSGAEGRKAAATDAIGGSMKTRVAGPLANAICSLADPVRRFPSKIAALFEAISKDQDLTKDPGA